MGKRVILSLFIACSVMLFSCEKEVHIKLNSGDPQLVVDGQIETNGYPLIVLTKSVGYFSTIDLTTLQNSFVHDAVITISDGSKSVQLREYTIDTGSVSGVKFSFYTIDSSDASAFLFKGEPEKYYSLKIESEGKTYTSVAKIPEVNGVDSIWFRKPDDVKIEDAVLMYARYNDPDTLGNYVRYFTKRNREYFLTSFNSTFDDQIVNGTTIDSLTLPAGYDKSKEPNQDSIGFFFVGDTVTLKWCAIDKGTYTFYSTFEYATGSVGNPFSSPINVTSNIQGGALGVWAAYGVQLTTKIVKQ